MTATLVPGNTWDFNTATTNNMGPDGFSWAQASVRVVDAWGKWIVFAEASNGDHHLIFSNDEGATWTDGLSIPAVTRADMDMDRVNDILFMLFECSNATDGILLRRYSVARDGSHNIVSFTQMAGLNLQLDYQGGDSANPSATMAYFHPRIVHMSDTVYGTYGAALCAWYATKTSPGQGNELRCSMRILSNTSADNDPTLWKAPAYSSSAAIGVRPGTNGNLPYTMVHADTTAPVTPPGFTCGRVPSGTYANDLVFVYAVSGPSSRWRAVRLQWSPGADDWSGGIVGPFTVSILARSGTDSGYARKFELPTKLCFVGNIVYVGLPVWASDAAGDTWAVYRINMATNGVTYVDVYSAGGAHSYAPTGDIAWNDAAQRLVVSYIKTGTQFSYLVTLDGDLLDDQDETPMDETQPIDVPLLYDDGTVLVNIYRATSVPYVGHLAFFDWVVSGVPAEGAVQPGGVAVTFSRRRRLLREFPWMSAEELRAVREQNAVLGR